MISCTLCMDCLIYFRFKTYSYRESSRNLNTLNIYRLYTEEIIIYTKVICSYISKRYVHKKQRTVTIIMGRIWNSCNYRPTAARCNFHNKLSDTIKQCESYFWVMKSCSCRCIHPETESTFAMNSRESLKSSTPRS
jgi:hypothetical protein